MRRNLKFLIFNFKLEKGFTLVELLIVVAIIGILSTLLTANFIGVRQRSKDAHRKADLRQIQSALELYRSDQGNYPNPSIPNCGSALTNLNASSTYMQKIPCDPNGGNYYYSSTDGTTYTLKACLENANDSEKDSVNANPPCNGTTVFSYTLTNP